MRHRVTFSVLFLLLFSLPLSAADLSGKWTGSGELKLNNGETANTTVYLDIVQKGEEITGNAGPGPEQLLPLSKGQFKGDQLTFEVVPAADSGYGLFVFQFKVSGDTMEGTVKCDRFTGTLTLKRSS